MRGRRPREEEKKFLLQCRIFEKGRKREIDIEKQRPNHQARVSSSFLFFHARIRMGYGCATTFQAAQEG